MPIISTELSKRSLRYEVTSDGDALTISFNAIISSSEELIVGGKDILRHGIASFTEGNPNKQFGRILYIPEFQESESNGGTTHSHSFHISAVISEHIFEALLRYDERLFTALCSFDTGMEELLTNKDCAIRFGLLPDGSQMTWDINYPVVNASRIIVSLNSVSGESSEQVGDGFLAPVPPQSRRMVLDLIMHKIGEFDLMFQSANARLEWIVLILGVGVLLLGAFGIWHLI